MALLLLTTFVGLAASLPSSLPEKRTDAPFGDKKGLAYNDGSVTTTLSRSGSATWVYNWGTTFDAPLYQQIPMYFSPGTGNVAQINAKIASGDTPYILGYNEPDELYDNGGCDQTPEQAYDAWGNDMFQFQQQGVKLVCPAVTSWDTTVGHTGGPAGLTWLRQFANNFNKNPSASGPSQFRCTAQALHWYGTNGTSAASQAQAFIDYIAYAHTQVDDIFQTTNMDLWITEFSPLPLGDAQLLSDFLTTVIPWLDAQSWVARYSPFKAEYLVSGTSLNVAGQTFVNTS